MSKNPIQEVRQLLEQHEQLGSAYLDSPYPDQAYQLALGLRESSDEPIDRQHEVSDILMRACEAQGKILMKQMGIEGAVPKFEEALQFSKEALASLPEDEASDRAKIESRRGSIFERLGRFSEAEESFSFAFDFGDDETLAEALLLSHRLYTNPKSPYYNIEKALKNIADAREIFEERGDKRMVSYADRYKGLVLFRAGRKWALAKHLGSITGAMWCARRELSTRARHLK